MTDALTKTCRNCGCTFPATTEYFNRSRGGKYGLRAICRECRKTRRAAYEASHDEQKREYRAAHREELHAHSRAYRENHREEIRAKHRAYDATHREERRAYRAEHREETAAHKASYYNAHRREINARNAAHYAEHRKEILTQQASYRANHSKELRARSAAYKASPRGKLSVRVHTQNRRALKCATGDTITTFEYADVLKAHTNERGQIICAWCGKPIKGDWHFDHWIPLSKGGRHEAGNLRVMHGKDGDKCNLRKGAKHPFEFGRLI